MIKTASAGIFSAGVLMGSFLLSAPAYSQQDERDLANIECRQIMILSGIDRDTAVAFIHGYMVGQADEKVFDLSRLTAATEIFLHDCLDSPRANALAVMKGALSKVPASE